MLSSYLTRIMQILPSRMRRTLKNLYERKPGFGRKHRYAQFGDDAFVQAYFREKFHRASQSEMAKSKYLRDEPRSGFYVDVGASSPVFGSNTYWFYQQG